MKRRDFLVRTAGALGAAGLPGVLSAQSRPCPPGTVSLSGGQTISSTCKGLPDFVSGLAPFQVRNLSGPDFGPANGKETMWSVTPDEWRSSGQPFGLDNVLGAYSGGAGYASAKRFFVHGGGHGDSANNGVYQYELGEDSRPVGWSILPARNARSGSTLSYRSDVQSSKLAYLDGNPTAIHSYDQLIVDEARGRFYRFGGSDYGNGSGTPYAWSHDLVGGWTQLPANVTEMLTTQGNSNLGSTVLVAPDSSKCLFLGAAIGPFFMDLASFSTTRSGTALTSSTEYGLSSVYDSLRNRYVVVGNHWSAGPRVWVVTVDWRNNAWSAAQQTGTALADHGQGPSMCYDVVGDCLWHWAGRSELDGAPLTKVRRYSASTLALVQEHSLSGDSIVSLVHKGGGWHRFVYIPQWQIIALVLSDNAPVSIIKLPG